MAGITTKRLEQMEKAWSLLDEGHSRKDVAEIMEVSLPWIAKAVAYAKKIGRDIETPRTIIQDDEAMILNLAIPTTKGMMDEWIKQYGSIEKFQRHLLATAYAMHADSTDMYQKGYDAGFDEASGREAEREAKWEAMMNAPVKSPEEREAETKAARDAMERQLAQQLEGWGDENNDEPSAEKRAEEKPQIPDTCGNCGSRELVVFEDDRLYQCDKCLHEDTY